MKRMELLKIQHDLFWASKFHRGFDKLFHQPDFVEKFTEFLQSDIGRKWKDSEEWRSYHEWQSK